MKVLTGVVYTEVKTIERKSKIKKEEHALKKKQRASEIYCYASTIK